MITTSNTTIVRDNTNRKLVVKRDFAASTLLVWATWTQAPLLEVWWAPKPWKAVSKDMNFSEGGHWLYHMAGPEGEKIYSRIDFEHIAPINYFTTQDSFCDENGIRSLEMPSIHWKISFHETASGTNVEVEMTFQSEADIQTIIDMGFEDGFSMAYDNLDALLLSLHK